jgi:hypothetical protein
MDLKQQSPLGKFIEHLKAGEFAYQYSAEDDKAFFYPQGIEGLFEIYFAPADTFETVNTIGLPLYARMIPDRDRDEWVRLEIESNPLPICTRPQVLRAGRRT